MSENSKTNSKHEHANKGNEWFERERWHYFGRGFRGVSDEWAFFNEKRIW